MRLDVDTGAYASASGVLDDANHGVTQAVLRLSATLDRCAAMSGTDTGGRAWAESYDRVATDLVRASADLGGSMGAMADLLDASLANHAGADYSACLVPDAVAASGGRSAEKQAVGSAVGSAVGTGRGTERLTPAAVPSALGGVGGAPEGWTWLAAHLEGLLWPDADTARMRAAGAAWTSVAGQLDGWSASAADASYLLADQRSPEMPVARGAARELGQHGADLAGACRNVGEACTSYAEQVDAHHAEILGICRELMAWTVVDQATGAVLSFVTGGGAEVAAQLVESGVMGRFAVRVVAVLRRLVELAQVAAELIARGLETVTRVLARLKTFLALREVRALERVGVSAVGRRALLRLTPEVREQVDDAIERAATGKVRFPKKDGKVFRNDDPTYRLPPGQYRSWTVAPSGAKRGGYRVLIEGSPAQPNAIYLWDHVNPPVRIGP